MSAYRNNNIVKLTLLGDGNVGKTAVSIQFVNSHYVEYFDPTIEDSYRKQVVIDNEPCMLDILDTAGQEEFSAMRDQWIRSSEAFIIVYSITSRTSFDQVALLREQILRSLDKESVPIMLIGNKSDLEEQRVVTIQEGKDLAKCLGNMLFMETSAKNRTNIEECFITLVRDLRRRENNLKKNLNEDSQKKKSLKNIVNSKVSKIKASKNSICKMM